MVHSSSNQDVEKVDCLKAVAWTRNLNHIKLPSSLVGRRGNKMLGLFNPLLNELGLRHCLLQECSRINCHS